MGMHEVSSAQLGALTIRISNRSAPRVERVGRLRRQRSVPTSDIWKGAWSRTPRREDWRDAALIRYQTHGPLPLAVVVTTSP